MNKLKLRTTLKYIFTLCILLFSGYTSLAQNTYIPDPSFGENGIVRIDYGNKFNDEPYDLLILPDGRIFVAGKSTSSFDWHIAIAKLKPNGELDKESFGENGKLLIHYVLRDHANGIAVQPDGKILVSGAEAVGNGASQVTPSLYRFNSVGSLDLSFGDSGMVVKKMNGSPGELFAVHVLKDKKILVAGRNNSGSARGFSSMRLDSNGMLDAKYGKDGIRWLDYEQIYQPMDCVFLSDTAIIMASTGNISGKTQYVLAMMDSLGNPHPLFGSSGIVLTGIEARFGTNTKIALTANMKIILAGTTPTDGSVTKFSVFRFQRNGSIDSTFGKNGRVDIKFTKASNNECYDVSLDDDGKILLAGRSGIFSKECALARLNPDGSPDTTFAPLGMLAIDLNGNKGTHYLTHCLPLSDGSIITAGYDFASNAGDMMIVKFIKSTTNADEMNPKQIGSLYLLDNYPNPFGDKTTITYYIQYPCFVSLTVYDSFGNTFENLVRETQSQGLHNVDFNAEALAPGIYFFRLKTESSFGGILETRNMIKMK